MATAKTSHPMMRLSTSPGQSALAITVLMGGPSGEREVSLQSGTCVADALESLGHTVHREDIGPESLGALARQVDAVFIALHGPFGEDGQVQSILERRKLRYTGSGPEACALAMNKPAAKARFREAGVPTPRWDVATPETVQEAIAAWSLPLVVKPTREGSSLNCYIVREFTELLPRVEEIVGHYGECLIEDYVPGIELTVSILGEQALAPIEIRTTREFYDYQAKYLDQETQYLFEINLPPDMLEHIQAMSLAAHRCLGCRDFSRVDWRVDPVQQRAYILEVNAVPGLTDHSLLPKAAAQAGISMPQLCDQLVRMAEKRRLAE